MSYRDDTGWDTWAEAAERQDKAVAAWISAVATNRPEVVLDRLRSEAEAASEAQRAALAGAGCAARGAS